ncbi:MAG: cytochrome c3 family protein [Deltaproteobacteria bacterium]|nr:cytochrome c3 family protein [Deltaproteobacteria bacterium]
MAITRKIIPLIIIAGFLVFSGWLFQHDKAAEPGTLSPFHRELDDCTYCHEPWKGVSEERCLDCHYFDDTEDLRREIRFHEVGRGCMSCHKEHGRLEGGITKMDHTLLNEELLCSRCHFDPHEKLFGENCRDCHGIRTWAIKGYEHPAPDRTNCSRCHKGPASHYDERFWKIILEDVGDGPASPNDCWRCHTIFHWPHLRQINRS